MTIATQASQAALISGIRVPDSTLANEITECIRDTESTLLFNHSSRVYYFGVLAGQRRGLKFIPISPQRFLFALGLLFAALLLPGLLMRSNDVPSHKAPLFLFVNHLMSRNCFEPSR